MGRKKKIKKIKKVKRIKRERKKQEKVVIRKLVGQNTLKTNDVKIQIKKIKKQPTEKNFIILKIMLCIQSTVLEK